MPAIVMPRDTAPRAAGAIGKTLNYQAGTVIRCTVKAGPNAPAKGRIVIGIRFTNYAGKTVYHRHVLNHQVAGMMAIQEVVK